MKLMIALVLGLVAVAVAYPADSGNNNPSGQLPPKGDKASAPAAPGNNNPSGQLLQQGGKASVPAATGNNNPSGQLPHPKDAAAPAAHSWFQYQPNEPSAASGNNLHQLPPGSLPQKDRQPNNPPAPSAARSLSQPLPGAPSHIDILGGGSNSHNNPPPQLPGASNSGSSNSGNHDSGIHPAAPAAPAQVHH